MFNYVYNGVYIWCTSFSNNGATHNLLTKLKKCVKILSTICSIYIKWKCKWFKCIRLSSTFSKFIEFVVVIVVDVVNCDNQIKINWSWIIYKICCVVTCVCTLSCEIVFILTFQLVSAVKLYWNFNQFEISLHNLIDWKFDSGQHNMHWSKIAVASLEQYKGV